MIEVYSSNVECNRERDLVIRLNQDEMTQEQACNLTQQSFTMREDLKHDKIDENIVRAHRMKNISNVAVDEASTSEIRLQLEPIKPIDLSVTDNIKDIECSDEDAEKDKFIDTR